MNKNILLNFNTDSFSFKVYSNTIEEQKMIQEFKNDEKIQEFLPDFWKYIEETENDLQQGLDPLRYTTIVYFENKPLGLVTFFDMGNEFIFSYGIRPSARGKRLSSEIRKEAYDYIFSNLEDIEKITGFIEVNNENSLRSLEKNNFDNVERIMDLNQQKEFFKVSSNNPYLKKENEK